LILREAQAADWPEVAEFVLATPLESGTSFVLDRRPDFGALPALRGRFRTFLVYQQRRLAGTVTALWHPARDRDHTITLGEIIDLRVAPWARGGRTTFHLLRATQEVFVSERVDWMTCLVGDRNRAVIPALEGRAGLPPFAPLEHFASVHFVAARLPRVPVSPQVAVRAATASDAGLLAALCAAEHATQRFAPTEPLPWPDTSGRHRAWIALSPNGTPYGALVTWDGEPARRLRVMKYRLADWPLRIAIGVAARARLSNRLPGPGEVLRLWATRLIAVTRDDSGTLAALVHAALTAAVADGQNVLQVNLSGRDPLFRRLPRYPRSSFWSTLYGCPCNARISSVQETISRYHADIARV